MLSEELVDRWFSVKSSIEMNLIRDDARQALISKACVDSLDFSHPDKITLSEECILKRHVGLSVISTHFYEGVPSVDTKLISIQGEIAVVEDVKSGERWNLLISRHFNFFGAIRVLEYIEQGKYEI